MTRMKRYHAVMRLCGCKVWVCAWAAMALLAACYSNNCPLENTVTCNYAFFDSEGNAISYGDTITVTTLKPGYKTVYIYRKLGNLTVTKEERSEALIEQGYTETTMQQRRDTVLINQQYGASSIKVPMSYFNEEDTLVFAYKSISMRDTIKIRHSSFPHVELPECGTYRFHSLRGITATDAAIDHIEISNPTVNYDRGTNVKIYFNGVAE